jgi:hypothetical protein
MTTVTTNALIGKLTEGSTSFKFRKVDGSIREANGTLNNDLIPAGEPRAQALAEGAQVIPFYDLDENGWRSFRADSVIG